MLRAFTSAALGICLLFVAGCSSESGVGSERTKLFRSRAKSLLTENPRVR